MFRIGQRVVCVKSGNAYGFAHRIVTKGEEYTVSGLGMMPETDDNYQLEYISLVETKEAKWDISRFRPLDEDYAEGVLSEIKNGVDETLELLEQIKTKETVK